MNRFDGNILSFVVQYATPKEVFIHAAISKIWSEVMIVEKKNFFKKIGREVLLAHLCDNFCPCFFEKCSLLMTHFHDPKKMICNYLNNEPNPPWVNKYLKNLEKV